MAISSRKLVSSADQGYTDRQPNREKVGSITRSQLREIAEQKYNDMNANDIESAMRQVEGTAKNMGITIKEG